MIFRLTVVGALLLTFSIAFAQSVGTAVVPLSDDFFIIPIVVNEREQSDWGASGVSAASRPDQSWISLFDSSTPVTGINSQTALQDAVDACVDYCVIQLDQITLSSSIYINNDKVKLLGSALSQVEFTGDFSLFLIETGASEIVIENLNIVGQALENNNNDVYGILVDGEGIDRVSITNNSITKLYSEQNAHGIAVFGRGATEATANSNIIIQDNDLDDLRTGASESIVVNGNVKNWAITNNSVSNVNNIAIDAIGGEGVSPTQTINGRVLPGVFDVAREGFIEGNTVNAMSTLGNPQYDNVRSWAAGVYVDGGSDIVIDNNVMINTPWGIEVGAENCLTTSNITVTNNSVSGSYFGDVVVGGYAETGFLEDTNINCDPSNSIDDNEGHGYVENITIKSNTLTTDAPEVSNVELQFRIRQSVIIQDGVSAVNTDGNVSEDENSIRITE